MTSLSDQLPAAYQDAQDQTATSAIDSTAAEHEPPRDRFVNVGKTERQISALAGGALAFYGLSRRSVPGILLAAVGGPSAGLSINFGVPLPREYPVVPGCSSAVAA